jgi:hypothetical protein
MLMRPDVAVTWPFARLTRLDVALIMRLLAISLAISETLTRPAAGRASRHICHAFVSLAMHVCFSVTIPHQATPQIFP